jgi:signal transduction histidine kinase
VGSAVNQAVESSKGELEIRFERDEALPRVAARAGSLGEAVRHLLVNALEASEARPAAVTVRTARAASPSDLLMPVRQATAEWVRVDVEDHGAGMDEEAARHCVVPFYTTKRATDQHGLGLALVCSYAYGWGGGLDVRSRPGAGTTVSVYLPVAQP